MKRIITLSTCKLQDTIKHGGCGACQTSCQSACKTSCGVANQKCENTINRQETSSIVRSYILLGGNLYEKGV